mgnify:CR=1 FL=1
MIPIKSELQRLSEMTERLVGRLLGQAVRVQLLFLWKLLHLSIGNRHKATNNELTSTRNDSNATAHAQRRIKL